MAKTRRRGSANPWQKTRRRGSANPWQKQEGGVVLLKYNGIYILHVADELIETLTEKVKRNFSSQSTI